MGATVQPAPIQNVVHQQTAPGQSIKITDPDGAMVFDLDSTGCLVQQNPSVIVSTGTVTPILETKKSACAALLPATPLLVKTKYGWFSTQSNSIQIV